MEKVSSSLTVLAEKSNEKDLILEFHLGGNLKMQICWQKTFHFFHVWTGVWLRYEYLEINPIKTKVFGGNCS